MVRIRSQAATDAIELARAKVTGPEPEPQLGKQTASQGRVSTFGGGRFDIPGFGNTRGTIRTYKLMRQNPTIALARMAATAPIRAADYAFVGKNATDEQVELIQSMIEPQLPALIRNALFALDYGNKSFEKQYEFRDFKTESGRTRPTLWLRRLNPLSIDATQIVVNPKGTFLGLRNKDTNLAAANSFVYTHDGEDCDLHGRPRHENIRLNAWQPWADTLRRLGQYVTKASGVIPIVRYVPGEVRDIGGAKQEAHDMARQLIRQLGSGEGVIHPVVFAPWAEDLMQEGKFNLSDLLAWKIEFLEVKPGHGTEFIQMLKYYDALMLRGWLVPERAAVEGTEGTKAEAGVHGDLMTLVAEDVLSELLQQINDFIVDPVLALNFGPDARGSVVIEAAPLVDKRALLVREIVKAVLINPANTDILLATADLSAMVDQQGIPAASNNKLILPRGRPSDDLPDLNIPGEVEKVLGPKLGRRSFSLVGNGAGGGNGNGR
ncbi:hypothetical protein LCGC14_1126540 [marine sediment metagenome]|uniref:Phage portal protein n=1 Tax=marine sediment metagenome TaxID=412755 RepID=A0A0F9PKG8_9ZZZZ